jgi:hypothetical protein
VRMKMLPVDPRNVPAFFRLVHYAVPSFAQKSDKSSQGDPSGGVHVDVSLVPNVVLVNFVGQNSLSAVTSPQNVHVTIVEIPVRKCNFFI